MAMLSSEELNNIRNSVDIVDVVSRYITLIPRGKNYMCACPFHNDNNPSMSVSKEKQIFTCFSCHKSGNVFTFISEYEHIPFIAAVKKVADFGGINVNITDISSKRSITSSLFDIYDISQKFYQNNLYTTEGKDALDYLLKRKLDNDTIKEFGIGVSLKKRDLLTKLLIGKKYKEKDIENSGLVFKTENGYLDMFSERIMFPLHDLNGSIIGFSGRIYNKKDISKYINTKQTEIFKKGELLYNYHRAKEHTRKTDTIIIMEGFMDLFRAYMADIKNVVATMGTAVTKEQATLIKRMAKNVIICFDGDSAGARATLACINELLSIRVIPKVIRLEEGLDPDEYILKYGKEKFLSKIDSPKNIIDFKIDYLKENKDLSSPEEMAKYVNEMLIEIEKLDDKILMELALRKISEESNLDIEFLKSQVNKKEKIPKKEIIKPPKNYESKYEKAEKELIYYMLRSKEVIKMYNKKVTYMPTEKYRFLAREISEYYNDYQNIDIASLLDYIIGNVKANEALSEILILNLDDKYKIEQIEDYIKLLMKYNLNYEIKRLKEEIKKVDDVNKQALLGEKIRMLQCEISESRNNNV